MPRFMLLIHGDAKRWKDVTDAEQAAIGGEYFAITQSMVEAGVLLGGDPLESADRAQFVSDGGVVTDGPFAEVAEYVGGYYLIQVDTQADAVEWAKRMPTVVRGLDRVEVREVRELGPEMMP